MELAAGGRGAGLNCHDWGSHRSWDHGSALLRVALMLESQTVLGGAECCGCGVTVSGLMAVGPSIHVFVCRDWRDA